MNEIQALLQKQKYGLITPAEEIRLKDAMAERMGPVYGMDYANATMNMEAPMGKGVTPYSFQTPSRQTQSGEGRERLRSINNLNSIGVSTLFKPEFEVPKIPTPAPTNTQDTGGGEEDYKKKYEDLLAQMQGQAPQGDSMARSAHILGRSLAGDVSAGAGAFAGLNFGLGAARNALHGYGIGKTTTEAQREARKENPTFYGLFQEGGGIPMPEELGMDFGPEGEANPIGDVIAELEGGEVVMQEDGTIQDVEGPSHEEGGVPVTREDIPGEAEVLSDELQVGEHARGINEIYSAKVKETDTFAIALEKIETVIGLDKIEEEQEKISKKLKEVEKSSGIGTDTKELNKQELFEQMGELDERYSIIEEEHQQAFHLLYDLQEQDKALEEGVGLMEGQEMMQQEQGVPMPQDEAAMQEMMMQMQGMEGGEQPHQESFQGMFREGGGIEGGGRDMDIPEYLSRIGDLVKDINNPKEVAEEVYKYLKSEEGPGLSDYMAIKEVVKYFDKNRGGIMGDDMKEMVKAFKNKGGDDVKNIISTIERAIKSDPKTREANLTGLRLRFGLDIDAGEMEELVEKESAERDAPFHFWMDRGITSEYGKERTVEGEYNVHFGVDFEASPEEEIPSFFDGKVEEVSKSSSAGWQIKIKESGKDGQLITFMHLYEKPELKKGDEIRVGDIIGKAGSTGKSTGTHIHFQVGHPTDVDLGGEKFKTKNSKKFAKALQNEDIYREFNPMLKLGNSFGIKEFTPEKHREARKMYGDESVLQPREQLVDYINDEWGEQRAEPTLTQETLKEAFKTAGIDGYDEERRRYYRIEEGDRKYIEDEAEIEEITNSLDGGKTAGKGFKLTDQMKREVTNSLGESLDDEYTDKIFTESKDTEDQEGMDELATEEEVAETPIVESPSNVKFDTESRRYYRETPEGEKEFLENTEGLTGDLKEAVRRNLEYHSDPEMYPDYFDINHEEGPTKVEGETLTGDGIREFEDPSIENIEMPLANPFTGSVPLAPSPPIYPTKHSVTPSQMSNLSLDVSGRLANIDREVASQIDQLKHLPPAMQAEMEAEILGQGVQLRDQVLSEKGRVELESYLTTMNQNRQIADQTQAQNITLAQDYEDKVMQTSATMDQSIRDWYDTIEANRRTARKDNVEFNIRNAASDNYMMTADGRIIMKPSKSLADYTAEQLEGELLLKRSMEEAEAVRKAQEEERKKAARKAAKQEKG